MCNALNFESRINHIHHFAHFHRDADADVITQIPRPRLHLKHIIIHLQLSPVSRLYRTPRTRTPPPPHQP